MKNFKMFVLFSFAIFLSSPVSAQKIVLSDLEFFKELGVPILKKHPRLSMAFADIEGISEERLHQVSHDLGRCGGFENLSDQMSVKSLNIEEELFHLEENLKRDRLKLAKSIEITKRDDVATLAAQVSAENLRASVTWMEGMGTRYYKAPDPNRPVLELEKRLKEMLSGSKIPYRLETVDHSSIKQKSVKLTFPGTKEPQKKIILGAHFDSIVTWGGGSAPGADDNASGSANLIEVARILSGHNSPLRTVEFYWYAGEEGGLIGSAEIAKQYKQSNEDVIAVMQLDMTLFPGDGPFMLGSVTDFTTPWVRDLVNQVNDTYFGYRIQDFQCGYGCSDHASWYRQGYSTVAPFEARKNSMNRHIHTVRDKIQDSYNFDHAAAFSKLALGFILELDVLDQSLLK